MGAAGSVRSSEMDSDPWWSPCASPLQSTSNRLTEDEGATNVNPENKNDEETVVGEELWLKQIQSLGEVIQNLSSENLKLLNSNRELKNICKEQESKLSEKTIVEEVKDEEACVNLQVLASLQEAAANDKKLIEDLRQQLQTNTEISAVEVAKYHENLNFMHMKVKEYEQAVEKLEKDASIQSDAIQSLQCSLLSVDNDRKVAELNTLGIKETIETLKQEHKTSLEGNRVLKEQLEMEKNMNCKMNDENQKLQEELREIKQFMCLQRVKRTSENSDADSSDVDRESDQSVTACSSSQNEEARTLSSRAAAELDVFQKQMKVKREARHKALSAISMEMERLRKELNSEREEKCNVVKELEKVRSMSEPHHIFEEVNDLKHKLTSERQEKEKIYKELLEQQRQANEEIESVLRELEKERAKTEQVMAENKYMKEQLQESDQMLQSRSEENSQIQKKLEDDRAKYQQQISALKEVVAISKQMLTVRENQVTHLKQTLQDVEATVVEKSRGSLTAALRAEYETQMENIKSLKTLYEERMQVMNVEKEGLISEQKELQRLIEEEKRRIEVLETELQGKEEIISERNEKVSDLQDQLSEAIDQSRDLSYELTLINNMFTQILGSSDMDLDRLTKLLQENHDLITEITTKSDCSETSASLPKLLLDLVSNVENAENNTKEKVQECSNEAPLDSSCSIATTDETSEAAGIMTSNSGNPLAMQDISSNLPKVWKVLLELVSHHVPCPSEESSEDCKSSCYKNVDTPYGPKRVISVSKTFLRLRDLILQKKSLQKEVTRLKQLNVHLETKLNDQERRLSLVSTELRKTWNVVDHMRVQHQQLHTHEKVLRYELQQKRKLLMELKEELEYCREKWEDARQKNSQSETEWQLLRKEFAQRKNKPLSNSGESGFSEEKDEDGIDNDVMKTQTQRKPSNSGLNNLNLGECIDQQMKTDKQEIGNNSATSLPDLVAVAADLPLPQSEENSPLEVESNNETDDVSEDSVPHVQDTFPLGGISSDSSILEPSLLEECSTVSLVTLLKQQLSCFSKNLEIITTGFDTNDQFKALQSIFALPAIQIPDHLISPPKEPPLYLKMHNFETTTRTSIDRGIQCTEDCHEASAAREETVPKTIPQCSSDDAEIMQEQKKFSETCIDMSSSSSTSLPCNAENTRNYEALSSMENIEVSNYADGDDHSSSKDIEETRSERLQRIERQCQKLFEKVTRQPATSNSSSVNSKEEKEEKEKKEENKSPESINGSPRNLEDMLDARAARLKRLEEQSQQLFKKVTRTTHRSTVLSNRLEELHEQYGSEENAGNVAGCDSVVQNSSSDHCANRIPDPPTNELDPSKLHTIDSSAINSLPGPSTHLSHIPLPSSIEDIQDGQTTKSKKLEEQSQQLFNKDSRTIYQSEEMSNQLEDLHEQYDNEEPANNTSNSNSVSNILPQPPPFLDHLPPRNLPSANLTKNCQMNRIESSDDSSSTSSSNIPAPSCTEMLDAQEAILERLDEPSQQHSITLLNKMTITSASSEALSNHHEEHREQYENKETAQNSSILTQVCSNPLSRIPQPPPFPDHLLLTNSPESVCLSQIQQGKQNESIHPSTSTSNIPTPLPLEDMLDARAARLKRLEEQSKQLFNKVKRTTHRSAELSSRLEELHEQYGGENVNGSVTNYTVNNIPEPPPLPDHIMPIKLATACLTTASSSHIPSPPPLPIGFPSVRLPTEMDLQRKQDREEKKEEEKEEEKKEER